MIQNENLQQAVLDDPNDLDARLVYGDWLVEHGDPRGEFIQCEVSLERLPKWSIEYADTYYRAQQLSMQNRGAWDAEIVEVLQSFKDATEKRKPAGNVVAPYMAFPSLRSEEKISFQYRVGFADDFAFQKLPSGKDLERLLKVTPIRRIKMTWFLPEEAERMNTAMLDRVRQLDLHVGGDSRCLKRILGGQSKLNLDTLRLYIGQRRNWSQDSSNSRTDKEMASLAQLLAHSKSLTHLKAFSVNAAGFGEGEITKLVDSPTFANLESLTLVEGSFGDAGMQVITDSYLAKQLKYLKVKLTGIGDKGFQALAHAEPINLQTLSMGWWYGSNPSVDGFSALTSCPALSGLYHFDLQGWRLGPESFSALTQSENMSGLRMLNVANAGFNDEMANLLSESSCLQLHFLNLESNPDLAAGGFQGIANSQAVSELTFLNLRDCGQLGDSAVQSMASSESMNQLRSLSLERTGLTSRGIKSIANSPQFANLRSLNVSDNELSSTLGDLADSDNLPNLQELNIGRCKINSACRKRLKRRFGPGLITIDE